jgi:HEPN domain-containing protein
MPPHQPEVGTPADWLRYARSDLALARIQRPTDVLLDTLCSHAQQVVERSIKAVLLSREIHFPYTHDIARLITLMKQANLL